MVQGKGYTVIWFSLTFKKNVQRITGNFIVSYLIPMHIYSEMHGSVFSLSGFQNTFQYRYMNRESKEIDFEGFSEDLSNASVNSVVILHACGHNPTGLDLTKEQWRKIAEIIKVS